MSVGAATLETARLTQATRGGLLTTLAFPEGRRDKTADYTRWWKVKPNTRGLSLKTSPYAGLLTISGKGTVSYLLAPRQCRDEDEKQWILGSASNSATAPVARLLPMSALGNFLTLCPKSIAPKGSVPGERPVEVTDPRVAAILTNHLTADFPDGKEIFVHKMACSLPIPGGVERLYKGSGGEQSVMDMVHDMHGENGINWLTSVLAWSPDIHATLFTPEMANYLPPNSVGVEPAALYTSPHVTQILGDLNEDEELMAAAEQLLADCEALATAGDPTESVAPPIREIGAQNNADGYDSDAPRVPRVDKVQKLRNDLLGKASLLGVRIENGKLTPVGLSKVGTHLVQTATTKAEATTIVTSGLKTTSEEYQNSTNFLLRHVNQPKYQAVTKAYMGNLIVDSSKRVSMSDTKAEGLSFLHFLADTKASTEAKGKDAHKHIAELALDEAVEKRSKLDTEYTPVESIKGVDDVTGAISNCTAWWETLWDFDVEATFNKKQWPFFVQCMIEIAMLLTGSDSKDFLNQHKGTPVETQFAYYVLTGLTSLFSRMGNFSADVIAQAAAVRDDWENVSAKAILKAEKAFTTLYETIEGVLDETLAVPESTLWMSSIEKKTHDRTKKLLLKQELGFTNNTPTRQSTVPTTVTPSTTTPKRTNSTKQATGSTQGGGGTTAPKPKLHNDPPSLGGDGTDGYIIVPTGKHLTIPAELNGVRPGTAFSLFKAFYQKGKRCRHGQSCNRSHKHPKDLPTKEGSILWSTMAGNNQGLCWNEELVAVGELAAKFGTNSI